eukprot:760478-Pleurochrysis_carterae.AAC.1
MTLKPTQTASTPEAQASTRRRPHRRKDQTAHRQGVPPSFPDLQSRNPRKNQLLKASNAKFECAKHQ